MSTEGIRPKEKVELKPASILLHLTKYIGPGNSLDGWFEKLREHGHQMTMHEWISHLHIGFEMYPCEKWRENPYPATRTDLVRSYLDFADGHCSDDSDMELPEDSQNGIEGKYFDGYDGMNKVFIKPSKIRQRIAQKAIKELVDHFFKEHLPGESERLVEDWAVGIVKDGLLTDLQYFFRVEKKYENWRITNLNYGWRVPSTNGKILIPFLLNLAKFLWEWEGEFIDSWWKEEEQIACKKRIDDFQDKLDQAKPWMIEVLANLGRLDILNKYLLKLDEESLNKLKEIALRTKLDRHKHSVDKDRLVKSIEEALYAGSTAAALLFKHDNSVKVDEILRKVQEEETKIREAERKLAELKSGQ